MTAKYDFSDVREHLLHSIDGAYPTKWEAYQTASVLGEDVFGSPKPHPNAVFNLFLEQNVKSAIPMAAHRAALAGFTSLINDEPGTVLSRLTLASTIYGVEVMRGGVSKLAYSIVCGTGLRECGNEGCLMSLDIGTPEQGMEGLNKIYDVIVKKEGDLFSPLSLGDTFCASCAKPVEREYNSWCATVWKNLPRIFRVGKGWDEL